MQVTKAGESRRFKLPIAVDRRLAIVIALALVAGMAGHLIVQAFSPGRAGAAQPRPSVLAIDSQPAIYMTPSAPPGARVVNSQLKPDIDIQPHIARKHRQRRHEAERTRQESARTEKTEQSKEEETQSVERIDSEEGTTLVPKRHNDEEPPKEPPGNNFNGLDG